MNSRIEILKKRVISIIKILQGAVKNMKPPASQSIVEEFGRDPFLVLVGCVLSLRTKDTVSLPASRRLFHYAKTPEQLLALPVAQLAEIIYPVAFYRVKAAQLHVLCQQLITNFSGVVPQDEAGLLSLKGVGRKTMNLVFAEGFGIPAICVDVHVHRISNRLGLVQTTTPEQTEEQLKLIVPREYWSLFNRLLVMWGQNTCLPVSPWCSRCPLIDACPQTGVARRR